MREVSVERVVDGSPPVVRRRLDPATVVEYEGSFEVAGTREEGDATVVRAVAGGLEAAFRFERREDGYYYTQAGEAGPFETMETWIRVDPGDDGRGSRVVVRSRVSLGLSFPGVTDRIAAWKRRGELRRTLDRLAADVEG